MIQKLQKDLIKPQNILNIILKQMKNILVNLNFVQKEIFQKYMKRAFEDVRTEVSNLNSFVQERVTGMKILQLFTRVLWT